MTTPRKSFALRHPSKRNISRQAPLPPLMTISEFPPLIPIQKKISLTSTSLPLKKVPNQKLITTIVRDSINLDKAMEKKPDYSFHSLIQSISSCKNSSIVPHHFLREHQDLLQLLYNNHIVSYCKAKQIIPPTFEAFSKLAFKHTIE